MSQPAQPSAGWLLAWSSDGRWLAVKSEPAVIRLLERVDEATVREQLAVPVDWPVEAIAISRDARWLAGAGDGQFVLWHLDLQGVRRRATQVSGGSLAEASEALRWGTPVDLAFSPDATSLAVAYGSQLRLLRLDPEALKPRQQVSTLGIRAVNGRCDFVLTTPAGVLTTRHELPPGVDANRLFDSLRQVLVPLEEQGVEALAAALLPWRERFLPMGLGEAQAMASTDNALTLDVESELADVPWELLLTGRGSLPLGCTQGLVRHPSATTMRVLPNTDSAPLHALFISSTGPGLRSLESIKDLNQSQSRRLVETLHESGPAQGFVQLLDRVDAREVFEHLLSRRWRLLVLVGDPDAQGQLRLDEETVLGVREIQVMRFVPDVVLLVGGDFRRQAALLREAGVAVVIASGWPVDSESLWAFFSEWLRILKNGEPLIRAAQMARQYAYTRSSGTAWALENHGDPLWTWPELPTWPGPEPDAAPASSGTQHMQDLLLQAVPGRDALSLQFGDEAPIALSPNTLQEVMAAAPHQADPGMANSSGWSGLLSAGLQGLNLLSGADTDAKQMLHAAAAAVDARPGPRLLKLDPDPLPADVPPQDLRLNPSYPALLLVPGLLADTDATFGPFVASLAMPQFADRFSGNLLAYSVAALTEHPIEAARTLVESLPQGTRLVLLTHGSGALVAEAIVRALLPEAAQGPAASASLRRRIHELRSALLSKSVLVERVVRVAGPVHGMAQAASRWDLQLALQVQLLEREGLCSDEDRPLWHALLLAVARDRDAARSLPGLATMDPVDEFIAWLHDTDVPASGQLRVIAGRAQGDGLGLRTLAVDLLQFSETDGLIPTRSTYGGVPRAGGASFFLDSGPEVSHYRYFKNARSAAAISDALLLDEPTGFAPIGPLSWAGRAFEGSR